MKRTCLYPEDNKVETINDPLYSRMTYFDVQELEASLVYVYCRVTWTVCSNE